jgi:hypothetical protein
MNQLPYELIDVIISYIPIVNRMLIIFATKEKDPEDKKEKDPRIFRDNPYENLMEKTRKNRVIFYILDQFIKLAPLIAYLKYKDYMNCTDVCGMKKYYKEWKNMDESRREYYIKFLSENPFLTIPEIERQIYAREKSIYSTIVSYIVCDIMPIDEKRYNSDKEKWEYYSPLYRFVGKWS